MFRSTIYGFLEVFFVVVIQFFIFDNVEFDRVKSDDFEFRPTLFTRDAIALIGVCINVHIGIAFGACSSWQFLSTSSAFGSSRRSAHPVWGDSALK
jgi:hypothetical protein